ncbi:MAG: FHA domain-containing protein [Lachnospiraceae bacterium]|nr:FHA domain-containing protein [Lachnospiraceae bacterium]
MEVVYKKNLNNNYVVLANSNIVVSDFRLNMLLKNKIKGFLPIYVGCLDGRVEISYLIDSKQSLKQLLERKKLNSNEIINIIKGIINVMDLAGQYLLKVDDILLDMNLIFTDYNFEEIWFCYYPNSSNNFYEELKKLSQRMLLVTEHSDMKAIEIMYKFFDICSSNDVSINELEKSLVCTSNAFNYYSYNDNIVNDYKVSKVCESNDDIYGVPERKWKLNLIIDKIQELFNKERFRELSKFKENNVDKSNDFEEDISEYTGDDEEEYDNETILVSDIIKTSDRKLLSLTDKNDIIITGYPFIIGKLNARADYILDDKLISRLHLKIHREGEEFYIEDMNSKNGSFLNDIQLSPYEMKKMEIGDKITIAKYDYIFR